MTARERQPPPYNFQRASFRLILLRGLVNRDKLAALLRATRPRQVARGCYDYRGSFLGGGVPPNESSGTAETKISSGPGPLFHSVPRTPEPALLHATI
ncbi:hypothetical protein K0M31_015926 [Melipona bicolor]|uniref:Uncharacterized protein n=1 Tax=Melipona bicolor TaxID=60889 RepID=A0AA40G690_9HYME|nr:hypothetical protein K0M31_015926 [Melipona bicolor]